MIFSSEFLSGMWFEIYRQVVHHNNQMKDSRIGEEQLVAVTTTIFIQSGQRGYLKPAPVNNFQQELAKVVAPVKDQALQKSIYQSVKVMVNGHGGKEIT